MFSVKARRILICVLVLFVLAQDYLAFVAPDGGWLAKHGLLGGFSAYLVLSASDPILLTGMVDFFTCAGLIAVWMISELPRESRFGGRTWAWLVAFVIYPGLGTLLYFLWLRPRAERSEPAAA